jgi:hypothetical protein
VTCHDDHSRWSQPEARDGYNLVLARRGRFRRRPTLSGPTLTPCTASKNRDPGACGRLAKHQATARAPNSGAVHPGEAGIILDPRERRAGHAARPTSRAWQVYSGGDHSVGSARRDATARSASASTSRKPEAKERSLPGTASTSRAAGEVALRGGHGPKVDPTQQPGAHKARLRSPPPRRTPNTRSERRRRPAPSCR